jgi:putative transposase
MSRYIDQHRGRFGVEPICRTLGVSASAYYQRASGRRSERVVADERLAAAICRLHEANYGAYGYRRVWRALSRTGERIGRDRTRRLMAREGLQGAKRRGKPWRTTRSDARVLRRPDLVNRQFTVKRPNALWVADLSYLRCWEGLVFFSFVIDAFSRKIVGWQLATNMRSTLVLDALRMALGTREHGAEVQLVHHSDAGSQGGFHRSSQRLIEEGCDGQAEGLGVGADGAAGDAFAGSSAGGAAGASCAVLDSDCAGCVERGGGCRGGGLGGGWRPVVSGGWRDAVGHPGAAVGAVLVVCGAGGDRDLERR